MKMNNPLLKMYIALKANSKLSQQHLQSTTRKCVILKDISNTKNDMKKHNGYNTIEMTYKHL